MKLGIGTYAYMWSIGFAFGDRKAAPAQPMSALGLLERAHELGLRLVQYGPNLPLLNLPERQLEALIDQAQAWGIEFELCTRGLETTHLAEQIALSQRLGSKLVRTIPEIGGQPIEAGEVPQYLRAILPTLEKERIKLGIENGKIPAAELKWALDQVPSPLLGVILDTTNSLAVPEGWRYVTEILAPYTICLHHKEFIMKRVWSMMGFICEGRPAGQGQVDTPWLFDTLGQAGASFNVTIETWPPEQPELEATIALEDRFVRESVLYLRQFVQE